MDTSVVVIVPFFLLFWSLGRRLFWVGVGGGLFFFFFFCAGFFFVFFFFFFFLGGYTYYYIPGKSFDIRVGCLNFECEEEEDDEDDWIVAYVVSVVELFCTTSSKSMYSAVEGTEMAANDEG